jgi:hypothetical protein
MEPSDRNRWQPVARRDRERPRSSARGSACGDRGGQRRGHPTRDDRPRSRTQSSTSPPNRAAALTPIYDKSPLQGRSRAQSRCSARATPNLKQRPPSPHLGTSLSHHWSTGLTLSRPSATSPPIASALDDFAESIPMRGASSATRSGRFDKRRRGSTAARSETATRTAVLRPATSREGQRSPAGPSERRRVNRPAA